MLKNNCPVCDSEVTLPAGTEESEIVSCPECHARLVVASIIDNIPTLTEAPKVEEDWGEYKKKEGKRIVFEFTPQTFSNDKYPIAAKKLLSCVPDVHYPTRNPRGARPPPKAPHRQGYYE